MEEPAPTTPEDDPGTPELEVIARLLSSEDDASEEHGPEEPTGPAPEPVAAAKLVAGRFEILGLLGKGANGRVFRVRDQHNQGREMALKILIGARTAARDFEARLSEYVGLHRRLGSDAINRLRDAGRTDLGLYYLCSDLAQGESVRRILDRRGALHPRHALEIARQVLLGLEQGHALGLVHGAIHAENTFLADRVPGTDENPFGVGVRLLDHGLAWLLDQEREPESPTNAAADDLYALGLFLVEILSGARPERDAAGWEEEIVAPLAPATHDLIERALDEDPGRRFPSAYAFRHALESSPDWLGSKAKTNTWKLATLVTFLVFVLTLVLLLPGRGGVEVVQAAEPDVSTEPGAPDPAAEERARLEETNRRLSVALDEAEADIVRIAEDGHRSAQELTGNLEELRGRLAGVEESLDGWRQVANENESRASGLAEAQRRARSRIEFLEEQLAAAQDGLERYEEEGRARRLASDPLHAAALGFDRVLEALETEGEGQARGRFEEARRNDVLLAEGWPGGDYIHLWLAGPEALWAYERGGDLADRSAELFAARERIRAAAAGREAFAVEAVGWLGIETDLIDEPVRLHEIDRVLDDAASTLAAERGPLMRELETLWSEIETSAPDRDPREVLAVCRWHEDGRLDRFLDRYAAHLQEASGTTGHLDLDGLRAVESLDAWADEIAGMPEAMATSAGREVLLMRYVLRWHDPERVGEAHPPGPVFHQGPGGGSPLSGWRAELELAARILDETSAFPGSVGTRSLYRTLTAEGTTNWQIETIEVDPSPPEDATDSWIVAQTFHDAEGRQVGERRRRVVQRGKRFYDEDVLKVLTLDLSLRGTFAQTFWSPSEMPTIPGGLPVRLDDVMAFRGELMVKGWRCLEHVDGPRRTLYSPELGLVRFEDPGRITRELIWVEGGEGGQ